jgi:hypothetical protein
LMKMRGMGGGGFRSGGRIHWGLYRKFIELSMYIEWLFEWVVRMLCSNAFNGRIRSWFDEVVDDGSVCW